MFKLININSGLLFVGISFCILSSISFAYFIDYIQKSKFAKFKNIIFGFIFIVFVLTSFIPSLKEAKATSLQSFDPETIDALKWIGDNTPINSTILTVPEEGYLVSAIAQRKNVLDTNYLLAPSAQIRLSDVQIIYETWVRSRALNLLNKYDVDYILLTDLSRNKYFTKDIKYANDQYCFVKVFGNEKTKVYKINC